MSTVQCRSWVILEAIVRLDVGMALEKEYFSAPSRLVADPSSPYNVQPTNQLLSALPMKQNQGAVNPSFA